MNMLKFVILDDETEHNQNMKKRLIAIFQKHGADMKIELITTEPYSVLEYSAENMDSDNVYFLDVDIGCDMNGIELAMRIRKHDAKSYIIFVSAHPEFVMPSLKTKIFDFLVKPISMETLEECVLSVYKDYTYLKNKERQTLAVKSGFNVHQLDIADIIFLEKYGHLLVIHTSNGQFRSQESLENIESKLDKKIFCRCHKSYLANVFHIEEIDNKNNMIRFKNGESCFFSKRCKKELNLICSTL